MLQHTWMNDLQKTITAKEVVKQEWKIGYKLTYGHRKMLQNTLNLHILLLLLLLLEKHK